MLDALYQSLAVFFLALGNISMAISSFAIIYLGKMIMTRAHYSFSVSSQSCGRSYIVDDGLSFTIMNLRK